MERPASGWDLRARAWLPALPQLGGKLTYAQYYAEEIALFGTDNRQRNPHAITAGVNYTPVPLITLGAERRQRQSGKSDVRFTLDMNYQIGVPWRSLVDPHAVAAMHSLAGSRHDLVERNNNIVLEYRRKEPIQLHMAALITGYAGEQKSLGVSVTSQYGLSHIDWDVASLTAAGGKIGRNGNNSYTVVLPTYQTAVQAVNTYTISAVAVDMKGNRSGRSITQLTVLTPEVSRHTSTFTPASSTLPADGKSMQELTLVLKNENNQTVDVGGQDTALTTSRKSATLTALIRKSPGIYTVRVTAGTIGETVTPLVSGVTLSQAEVIIGGPAPDARQSEFTVSPERITADSVATSTLTLIAKDAKGNALAGLKDNLVFVVKDRGEG